MLVNTVTTGDWELIVKFCHFAYTPQMPKHIYNEAYRAAWAHTDAYGSLGHMPTQGYDWSGFRDSSKGSNANSANAIRVTLAKHGITEFETVKTEL